jgi:hypothetical protein
LNGTACANEMAPGEGRVVAYDYGCGAHSDVVIDAPDHPSTEHAFDTTGYDELAMPSDPTPTEAVDEIAEADAVQAEVEAAAEPSSDDEVEEVAGTTEEIVEKD